MSCSSRLFSVAAALGLFIVDGAGPALANGRFPTQQSLHLHPSDPQVVYAATTFGLLVSIDGGTSFRWACEESIGYGGTYDPDYAVHSDGTLFATTFNGLRVSYDHGASWSTVEPFDADHFVSEVEEDPLGRLWLGAASTVDTTVYVSDDGKAFQPTTLDGATWWNSIVAGPAESPATQRVLASGYVIEPGEGDAGTQIYPVLYRSDDGGASWSALPLDDFTFHDDNAYLYIEAIDASNPDIVYASVTRDQLPVGDGIYRSTDGGDSWTKVLSVADDVRGFVIRQNGDVIVASRFDGTYVDTAGEPVELVKQAISPQLGCLAERFDGQLFACGSNWNPDNFAIAHGDPSAWSYLFAFVDIAGPISSAPGTPQYDICEAQRWCGLVDQLAIAAMPIDCPEPPDAGIPDARSGDDDDDGGDPGCCDVGGRPDALAVAAGLLGLALVLRRRRSNSSQR